MLRLCPSVALLLGLAACGVDGGDGNAPSLPRSRRIALISRVEGSPAIESTYTPTYEGDHIIAIQRTDQFADKNIMTLRYDGDNLVSVTDTKNTVRYIWSDGHPTTLSLNGSPIDFTFEDGLPVATSFEGEEVGRYIYERGRLVMVDMERGVDIELSYDAQDNLSSISGRPNAIYGYQAGKLSRIEQSNEVTEITYEQGYIKTMSRSGLRTPITITYTYGEGQLVGFSPVPPIPGAAMFDMTGRPLPTVELLSIDLMGTVLSAF